jgi:hypothetical protein
LEDCYICNTSVSLNVEGKPGHCVIECEDSYFKDPLNSICKCEFC